MSIGEYVIDFYRKLTGLLDRRERRYFFVLIVVIVIMGLSDMISVAAILPFLAVAADPALIETNAVLAALNRILELDSPQQFLTMMGASLLTLILFGMFVKLLTMYAIARFGHMRKYHISARLFSGYLRQPYEWFLNRHSAELSKMVLHEVDQVVGSALVPALRILAQVISLLFLVALLIVIRPVIALATASILAVVYIIMFLIVRHVLLRVGRVRVAANTERFKVVNEAFAGSKEVKLMGLEETYMSRFQAPARTHARTLVASQVISEIPKYVLETIAFGGMIALILVLLRKADGNLSEVLPVLGLFSVAGLRMLPAIQQIYHSLSNLRVSTAVLDAVSRDLAMLKNTGEIVRVGDLHVLRLRSQLVLNNVTYAYPATSRITLNELSLVIKANTTVAIVGSTGAGKTTAVDMILGLLEPKNGEIRVDGTPVTGPLVRAWQNNIGYVPQVIYMVDDTIAANIAFGVPAAVRDQRAVERAARLAELHAFVTKDLPEGYDTMVGERGVRLSGGQRQRIGIARALYHDPDVLILDEATNALDNLTERAVLDAVKNLGQAKTVIMIAHRLSTVQGCDKIFLMENGHVLDSGNYEELINKNDLFRDMAQVAR